MSSFFVKWQFELLSYLPLRILHGFGILLGWLSYWSSASYAQRMRENLNKYNDGRHPDEFRRLLRANVAETGKSLIELPWVWRRPVSKVLSSIRRIHGQKYFDEACRNSKGLIILTPHLGCFEIIGLHVAAQTPMTCMYTVPKRVWMDDIIRKGRQRGQMKLAPADLGGVRMLLKALKRGEVIGLLPDQVPAQGEGEWADFFGRPAYTMTLAGRLQEASGAKLLMSWVVRLPHGKGFELHFEPLEIDPEESVVKQLNRAQEKIIRTCPEQYLWSYNRYKAPPGSMTEEKRRGLA